MISSAAEDKPVPTLAPPVALPVQETILNPASTLALTVEFIEPSVLDEPLLFAFQFQATIVALLLLI